VTRIGASAEVVQVASLRRQTSKVPPCRSGTVPARAALRSQYSHQLPRPKATSSTSSSFSAAGRLKVKDEAKDKAKVKVKVNMRVVRVLNGNKPTWT